MADRMNKILLMMLSNILMTVGLIGFAYAQSVPLFIAMRIINGVGFAIGSTAQVALCTCFIPKSRMGEGIGYMGLSMVLASATAPGLGIAISQAMGMKAVFLVSAAMPVAGCLLLMFMRSDAAKPKKEKRAIRLEDILEWRAWAFSLCGGMFSYRMVLGHRQYYSPRGFLIDWENRELVRFFLQEWGEAVSIRMSDVSYGDGVLPCRINMIDRAK